MAAGVASTDLDAALNLFALLFPSGAEGYLEVRSISDGKAAGRFWPLQRAEISVTLVRQEITAGDYYVSAAPRVRRSGKKVDVECGYVVWVDLDSETGLADLQSFELEPSAVVATGSLGHCHAYWGLEQPLDVPDLERINRALAGRLGGDKNCVDGARVMRIPGTFNYKHSPPQLAELVSCSGVRYKVDEIEALLTDQLDAVSKSAKKMVEKRNLGTGDGPVEVVLEKLEEVQASGEGWKALCPAHEDRRPSLSISEGDDGRCLVKCHAGCETEDVVVALGLTMADLFAGPPSKRAATRLVHLAEQQGLEVFHDGEDPYASCTVEGHLRTWPIPSAGLERELRRIAYEDSGAGVGEFALREVTSTLKAKAVFDGEEKPVYRRVAAVGSRLLIDLGDPDGTAVEISADGWKLRTDHGLHFVREKGELPFPKPAPGGSVDELREFTNCADEASFKLLVGSILMCLNPRGPYPVILITGEQGSAKSTHSRLLASLADPRKAPLSMGKPKTKDLAVVAAGVRLLGFDNVSSIPPTFSDELCQLVTGTGFRARELFTDVGQSILEIKVGVQMNAIGNPIKRPDLQERAAVIELKPIPPERRRTEEEFWAAWEQAAPRIFGAVLDAISTALANKDSVELDGYPRMADFARWVEAAAPALGWGRGEFVNALEGGQAELVEDSIEAHPELGALLSLLAKHPTWVGTTETLLGVLSGLVKDDVAQSRTWPKTPSALGKRLDEYAPLLRQRGFEFERYLKAGGNRTRMLRFTPASSADTSEGVA